MAKLIWLADVLRNADQKVVEVKGWRQRGGEMGEIKGVLLHHTAGPKLGNIPSLGTVTSGRPGLRGPLAHLALARDGTWYVVSAGRSNHAGKGSWKGLINGNSHLIGIEAENTGLANDMPWPQAQYDAYAEGVGAILDFLGLPAYCAIGHREWAPKRKIDPTFDMNVFREKVGEVMARKKKAIAEEAIEDFYETKPKTRKKIVEVDVPTDTLVRMEGEDADEIDETEAQRKSWPWQTGDEAKVPGETIGAGYQPAPKKKASSPTDTLESLGWKDYQAAALIAQAVVESKLDPKAATYTVNKQPTTRENPLAELTSFGIMKWPVSRLKNLDKFIEMWNHDNNDNKKKEDLDAQVRFIDWELRNSETPVAKQLRETTNLTDAVRATTGYVRPTGWSQDTPEDSAKWAERVVAAYELMNK